MAYTYKVWIVDVKNILSMEMGRQEKMTFLLRKV